MDISHKLNPHDWVGKFSDELFGYAYIRCNDEETARDLIQDTFLSALKNLESFKGEISEKNWLYLILKNKIIDHYRKKSKTPLTRIEEESELDEFFNDAGHWKKEALPSQFNSTVENSNYSFEFYEILEKCKRKLNEIQLNLFAMKFLDEMESDEICKEMEINSSNYWVLIHRIKLKIRKCIEKLFYGKEQ
ncbi:MAG: sigma-70 family RNA polymerase sigma factor [Ignavibacteriales bacterium]|nr:sigma-70 family RNA polymerase sigma factor [Ignavibacteriales bacterium]